MKSNYCTLYLVRHGETEWNEKKLMKNRFKILRIETGKEEIYGKNQVI